MADPLSDTTGAELLADLRDALGGAVTPLAGGYSGETFRAVLGGDDVVVRVYARAPERAAVDVALLRRLRGVVPVPAVLDAALGTNAPGRSQLPPVVITQWLPGERLDLVLDEVSAQVGRELGRSVGGVLLRLSTLRLDRPGAIVDRDLTVSELPAEAGSLEDWVREHLDRGRLAAWNPDDRAALLATARAVRPLIDAVAHERTLVHGDLNPKNLLVDSLRSEVTGLLDWEFTWSGCWLADLGNLLRFPPEDDDETGAAFVDGVLELLAGAGRLVPGWLDTARALDLFALVDLAARPQPGPGAPAHPIADRAADVLLSTARTGSLAAGRPDPGPG